MTEKHAFFPIFSDIRAQLNRFISVAGTQFLSWKNHPEYFEILEESFLRLETHLEEVAEEVSRKLLYAILETRVFHDMILEAYNAGEFQGALLRGYGQEALGAGAGLALYPHDVSARDIRSISCSIARGTPIEEFWMNHFMRSGSPTGGYDPNIHCADLSRNDLGFFVSDMAMSTVVINGSVWYLNFKRTHEKGSALIPNERSIGLMILGDGAASSGLAHAGMNFAKAWGLPIVYAILDNQISLGTSSSEQHGGINFANRGLAYEMLSLPADGDNVFELYAISRLLADFSRHANQPSFLWALTFRRCGHNETERVDYVDDLFDPNYLRVWRDRAKDPLYIARTFCETNGWASEEEYMNDFLPRARKANEMAHEVAKTSPEPSPEKVRTALIDPDCRVVNSLAKDYSPSGKTKIMTMKDAIQVALKEELRYDPTLLMLGEDIGKPRGGVFDLTAALLQEFGDRIKNSTLDESAIGGFLVGAGLFGGRVIGEYQFWNFYLAGMSVINTLAATRPYLLGVSIPGVLRGATGYAPQSNHYHENRPETYLLKAHGIKVVVPATPADAKGLLKSAIRDPDLVAFLEEMSQYEYRGEVPDCEYFTPFNGCVRRSGKDLTLVTWGPKMLRLAIETADALFADKIDMEVIDLRVLHPWDKELVALSIKKTGRLLILHEDSKFLGFGAEIAAAICEDTVFYNLKARPIRVTAENTPIPVHLGLENARLPDKEKILNAAKRLMEESHE